MYVDIHEFPSDIIKETYEEYKAGLDSPVSNPNWRKYAKLHTTYKVAKELQSVIEGE